MNPMTTTSGTARGALRELARRTADHLDVTLYWCPAERYVVVSVVDERDGAAWCVDARAADALEAFRHPFAYRPR